MKFHVGGEITHTKYNTALQSKCNLVLFFHIFLKVNLLPHFLSESHECYLGQPSCIHSRHVMDCCIRCGPNEERILDVVPREDGARNSG